MGASFTDLAAAPDILFRGGLSSVMADEATISVMSASCLLDIDRKLTSEMCATFGFGSKQIGNLWEVKGKRTMYI